MSRILRLLCDQPQMVLDKSGFCMLVRKMAKYLESNSAGLRAEFSFPFRLNSLTSGHSAYQYYQSAIEARMSEDGSIKIYNELEFVYSSACPCSAELSEHAQRNRAVKAIPHSQRSTAQIKVQLADKSNFLFEKLIEICRKALMTETQMIVRRQDEQAFAELNGDNQKFVEDAVRLLFKDMDSVKEIADFRLECTHFESLHSHNAVAVIYKGIRGGLS